MDETIKGQPHHRIDCRFAAIFLLATSVVAWFHSAAAQQTNKIYRVGYLSSGRGIEVREKAFRQGLGELGYIEGENIVME